MCPVEHLNMDSAPHGEAAAAPLGQISSYCLTTNDLTLSSAVPGVSQALNLRKYNTSSWMSSLSMSYSLALSVGASLCNKGILIAVVLSWQEETQRCLQSRITTPVGTAVAHNRQSTANSNVFWPTTGFIARPVPIGDSPGPIASTPTRVIHLSDIFASSTH